MTPGGFEDGNVDVIIVKIVRRSRVQVVRMRRRLIVTGDIGVQMEPAQRDRQKRNAGKRKNESRP